jgi:uncharacterized membrane protein
MRRIDAIGITLGAFAAGGIAYIVLKIAGLDSLEAGVWSQLFLVGGLVGWLLSYVFRVLGNNMTYHQQRRSYEEAFWQKKLDELSPEELAKLQAELEETGSRE